MLSSIMIFNLRGDILIYREYLDDVKRSEFSSFVSHLLSTKGLKEDPVIYYKSTTYLYVKQKDLILAASSKGNPNAALSFQFLYQFLNICKAYFGCELNDATVKKNFVLIYELLDEVLDFGVPQITAPEVLKQYILEGGLKLEQLSDFDKLKQITMQATGANSWRQEGIFYKKNNIYIDVIEKVSISFSNTGNVLKSEVIGAIQVKSELSGMPECKFGMNDKLLLQRDTVTNNIRNTEKTVTLNDIKFDQCVKLSKFDKERAITFIPPDGEFTLMNYRISDNINIPFKVVCLFQQNENKFEYRIKLSAEFEKTYTAQNVELLIPVPNNLIKKSTNAGVGKAKYDEKKNGIVWRLKKFQGGKTALLRVDLEVSKEWDDNNWSKPPLSLNFQIPMFTSSGVIVAFLKVVEKSGYKAHKWIRYLTKAGEYTTRL